MLFHRAHDCPRDHHRRGGGILGVFRFRCLAGFANCVPSRINLQVSRNDAAELARDCRRERRFDSAVAASVLGRNIAFFAAGDNCLYTAGRARSYSSLICRNFGLRFKLIR